MSLKNYLNSKITTKTIKKLPMFHTTRYSNLESIYEYGITPNMCNIMHKNLIYLFYGRGVYLKESKAQITIDDNVLAVSFGFNVENLEMDKIHKVYPFDSGAFNLGKYDIHIDRSKNIDNYLLDVDQINKYIEIFFGNELNYINGTPNLSFVPDTIETRGIYNLVKDKHSVGFDMRARTIEISYENILKLDSLNFIVIHERHSNNKVINNLSKNNNLEIMTYDTEEVGNERDIYTLVISKIKEYVKKIISGEKT